jgi:hypothetical protein
MQRRRVYLERLGGRSSGHGRYGGQGVSLRLSIKLAAAEVTEDGNRVGARGKVKAWAPRNQRRLGRSLEGARGELLRGVEAAGEAPLRRGRQSAGRSKGRLEGGWWVFGGMRMMLERDEQRSDQIRSVRSVSGKPRRLRHETGRGRAALWSGDWLARGRWGTVFGGRAGRIGEQRQ